MSDSLHSLADHEVRAALARELGRDIEYHARIGSTQDRARELRVAAIVVADEQTVGHGRHDRGWVAPAGTALLASWVYVPAPAEPALCALVAGVAVARALAALGAGDARLHWPNDVLLGDRKVAGVLAHGSTDGAGGALVVGIGVNVSQVASDFPADLRMPATSLALAGHRVDRLVLLAALSSELDRVVADRAAALEEWRARSAVLGRSVEIARADGTTIRGLARAVAEDGALILTTARGEERVIAGEVTRVR